MNIIRLTISVFIIPALLFTTAPLWCEDYLKEIDAVRKDMTAMGPRISQVIHEAKGEDIRTLERVFEINNYALVTIESYLKMTKIFIVSGGYGREEVLKILNNWLAFIIGYCSSDIKYLDETSKTTKDQSVRDIVNDEKSNIARLLETSRKGIDENITVFRK